MTRLALFIALSITSNALAADLTVDAANSPYAISTPQTFDAVEVLSGGTLTIDSTLTALSLTVRGGGIVTHSPGESGMLIDVAGSFTIDFGGTVTATGMGLLGGNAGSQFGATGEAYDTHGGTVVAGSAGGNGASYGGLGGIKSSASARNTTYGEQSSIYRVGAGGGGSGCGAKGGKGGGLMVITATDLVVNGELLAQGAASIGSGCGGTPGGGSGGGIFLTLTTLSGDGRIHANGGNGRGGGGGGGRIAALYDSHTYSGILEVFGGTGSPAGDSGSAWLISRTDELYAAGGRATLDAGRTVSRIDFGVGGIIALNGPATNGAGLLTITQVGRVEVNDAIGLQGVPIDPTISGEFVFNDSASLPDALYINPMGTLTVQQPTTIPGLQTEGSLLLNARLDITGDAHFMQGSTSTHDGGNIGFDLRATGNLTMDTGSQFLAANKGLFSGTGGSAFGTAGETYDPVTLEIVAGSQSGAGGSHGGVGGGAGSAAAYGLADQPMYLGGGGSGNTCASVGGRGGGHFRFEGTTVQHNGSITVDAGPIGNQGCGETTGGGAGGSVWIVATTFTGTGSIYARGTGGTSGAGAGGRIAVSYTTNTFSGIATAAAGTSGIPAADGTVNMISNSADVLVRGGTFTASAGETYPSITLEDAGTLIIDGSATITAPLVVTAGSILVLNSPDALAGVTLVPQVAGTLVVQQPITIGSLEISGTLVLRERLDVTNDVHFLPGSIATHDTGDTRFDLRAGGDIIIDTGALFSGAGLGLGAGYFDSQFGTSGETYDPTTFAIIAGSAAGSGGSYGGIGGGTSAAQSYGSPDIPTLLGGGGAGGGCGSDGGRGGGHFRLEGIGVQLNGSIVVDGRNGQGNACEGYGGGGAGGSAHIVSETFSGGGIIRARGGSSTSGKGGAGAGGRIAASYTTSTFSGTISAAGGAAGITASDGTVSLAGGGADHIIVRGGTFTAKAGDTFASVTLSDGGIFVVEGNATITDSLSVPMGSSLVLRSSDALDAITLVPSIGGDLVVDALFSFPEALTVAGTLTVNAPTTSKSLDVSGELRVNAELSVTGDVTLRGGGTMTHALNDPDFVLRATGAVTLEAASIIDVSGLGFGGGNNGGSGDSGWTIDPNTGLTIAGPTSKTGGSHGGLGGSDGTVAAPVLFDDPLAPVFFGGGGSAGGCASRGGRGGGRIRIDAGSLSLGGLIQARGANGYSGCGIRSGGGAGGSIWLSASNISGIGTILAHGGGGVVGGGGGRIMISYLTGAFTGTIAADGASASYPGEPGTAHLIGLGGDRTILGGSEELVGGEILNSVTLTPGATLTISGPVSISEPLHIPAGASLIVNAKNGLANVAVSPVVEGDVFINAENPWHNDMEVRGTVHANAATTVEGDVTVRNTIVINDRFLADNFYVEADALVTHDVDRYGMDINVTGMFYVHLTGLVDVDGKGLGGGRNGSSFGDTGESLAPSGSVAISGSGLNNGGSHGGLGGQSNAGTALASLYDAVDNPQQPGAGGGAGDCTAMGGRGGGVVRVSAGLSDIVGVISARGAPQSGNCDGGGGGAGGTINLDLGLFQGGSASTLSADGGASTAGGGGGGGIVRVSYAEDMYSGVMRAEGGAGSTAGAPGAANAVLSVRPPEILSTPPAAAVLAEQMRYAPVAIGNSPIVWTMPAAPQGATIDDATGVVLWTPSAVGSETFLVRATNGVGAADQTFSVDVLEFPTITSSAATQAWTGNAFSYDADDTAEATGTGPITWSASLGPLEFAIDATTGRIDWVPVQQGTSLICIVAANAAGSDEQCFVIAVGAGEQIPPQITSTALLTAMPGEPYAYDADNTPEATGTAPMTWTVFLGPTGLAIDSSTGEISWQPDTEGTDGVCIRVTNAWGEDSQCFTVAVGSGSGGLRVVSYANLATVQGAPYFYDDDSRVKAVGPGPITFQKAQGPAEFSIDAQSGLITWTPVDPGNTGIVITVSNSQTSVDHAFTVSVLPLTGASAPIIIHSANPLAAIDVPYLFDDDRHAEGGGSQPMSWQKAAGPEAFNIDAGTGMVTWVPTTAGVATVTISATNDVGTDTYTFEVDVLDTRGLGVQAVSVVSPRTGPAPLDVDVDGSQSYASTTRVISYIWDFGDGTDRIYEPMTAHTYERPGSYVLSLETADELGNVDRSEQVVVVTQALAIPPSAQILVSRVEGRDSLQVSFACDCTPGSSPVASYTWDFGNGEFIDSLVATHIFGPGAHQVSLTVVDEAGLTARDRVSIQVSRGNKVPPLIFTSANPASGIAPLTVALLADHGDYDGAVETITWDFGNGDTAAGSEAEVTYEAPGVYQVVATAIDNDGLTATSALEISVTTLLGETPPRILSQPERRAEQGREYHYDADDLPAATGTRPLSWKLGKEAGGSVTGAPAGMEINAGTGRLTWTPDEAGTFTVSLIATNAGGASLQEWDVEVAEGLIPPPDNRGVSAAGCGCASQASQRGWLALLGILVFARLWRRRYRGRTSANIRSRTAGDD